MIQRPMSVIKPRSASLGWPWTKIIFCGLMSRGSNLAGAKLQRFAQHHAEANTVFDGNLFPRSNARSLTRSRGL